MTVLIAAKNEKKVVVVSDNQVTMMWHLSGKCVKQFNKGDFIIAGSGSVRDLQLIQYKLNMPERTSNESIDSYIFKVSESIRLLLLGYRKDVTELTNVEIGLLIVSPEGLFTIHSDFSITSSDEVVVHGSGCDIALGAYHAMKDYEDDIKEKCVKAVEITNEHTVYCGKGVNVTEVLIK